MGRSYLGAIIGMAMLVPTMVMAASDNDLRDRVQPMDPAEMYTPPEVVGDYPADYEYTGNPNVGPEQAARQRVETRIQQKLKAMREHDDRDHQYTPQDLKDLNARAQKGDALAMAGMGEAYQHGLGGLAKNERLAVQWYQRAAEGGEEQYYSTIGDMYRDHNQQNQSGFFGSIRAMMTGTNETLVKKDNEVARQWYEKGIKHPDKDWRSYVALAEMYRDGTGGLAKDMKQADIYWRRGMQIKKLLDDKMEQEVLREVRQEAEREEGLQQAVPEPVREYQDPQQVQRQEDGGAIVMIDNSRCMYQQSSVSRRGYTQIFAARCPDLQGKTLKTKTVALPALECDIERHGTTAQMLLMCNLAKQETVRIGSADCSLRQENAREAYAAVYGAYCTGGQEAGVERVTYNGLECKVEPAAAGQGKQYTLLCGGTADGADAANAVQPQGKQARIGSYSCMLREADSPTSSYKRFYEAYCGNLTKEQKNSPATPRSVSVGVELCDVEPWPDNNQGKDFELHCK